MQERILPSVLAGRFQHSEDALGLAQFEVPGTWSVMGVPCRRALVETKIEGLDASAHVVATAPLVEREKLVGFARYRNSWWQWGGSLPAYVSGPYSGQWIVFGDGHIRN